MKRAVMVSVGAPAILAAGLAGCSGNKSVSTPNGGTGDQALRNRRHMPIAGAVVTARRQRGGASGKEYRK
jgi:hypothetical protein